MISRNLNNGHHKMWLQMEFSLQRKRNEILSVCHLMMRYLSRQIWGDDQNPSYCYEMKVEPQPRRQFQSGGGGGDSNINSIVYV